MTRTTRSPERRDQEADRKAAPAGVLGALGGGASALLRRWKLFLLVWAAVSVLLVSLVLLLPREYEKTVTLTVTPVQSDLQAQLSQPPLDPTQANNQAEDIMEAVDLGPVTVEPDYEPTSGQQGIPVQLQAENQRALADVAPVLVNVVEQSFRATYESSLGSTLRSRIATLDAEISGEEQSLAGVDAQIEETVPSGPEDVETVVRLTVLENRRQETLGTIAGLEDQRASFQEALDNVPELAAEPIQVEATDESPVRLANRRAPALGFAVLVGFAAAALVVLRLASRRG